MSDLYQTGTFATLHRLKAGNRPQIEREVKAFSLSHPIAVVLPIVGDLPVLRFRDSPRYPLRRRVWNERYRGRIEPISRRLGGRRLPPHCHERNALRPSISAARPSRLDRVRQRPPRILRAMPPGRLPPTNKEAKFL